MGKGRMTTIDIISCISELRNILIGTRLSNIYDLNTKTFLWKFAKSDEKLFLLIESGIRIHLTKYEREKADMPNNFCVKLRKHIRTKLLHDIYQMGMDRVIIMTFGTGENAFHIICEFYAAGNVILTDYNFKILSLLRNYELENDSIRVAVGEIYPINNKLPPSNLSVDLFKQNWVDVLSKQSNEPVTLNELFPTNSFYQSSLIQHLMKQSGIKTLILN